ncbi:MAG TPA: hypothetical protein PKI93_02210 [Alphaproteobacteria bacterium]|nr:hypothetical protein [Alphaproteobacteria bacterium]
MDIIEISPLEAWALCQEFSGIVTIQEGGLEVELTQDEIAQRYTINKQEGDDLAWIFSMYSHSLSDPVNANRRHTVSMHDIILEHNGEELPPEYGPQKEYAFRIVA